MEETLKQNSKDDALLSIKDLVVEYHTRTQTVYAVNGVSFDLKQGESLGLVGETGAGKTTICKSILQILPDQMSEICGGEIIFEGSDLLKSQESEMRHIRGAKISMVFQDPMTALNPIKTIGAQIADVIALHSKMDKKESWNQAKEILALVGIKENRMKEYPYQFSGGMKQRVVIAMALACNPILLLADEPTTALDVTIQAQVLNMVRDLKKARGTSMLLITHDLGIVAENCDNVAVIYAGQILEKGTVQEVFTKPLHPYTIGLFRSIPDITKYVEWLTPIEGSPPDPSIKYTGCAFAPRCEYATEECMTGDIPVQNYEGSHTCRCIHTDKVLGDET